MKAIRPKLSEFHHGRSIFLVGVGPDRGRTRLEARLQRATCLSRPYDAKIYRDEVALFIHVAVESTLIPGTTYPCKRSLGDHAAVWHGGRNLHRMFTKEKQALKYMNRINSGCLSATERKHLAVSLREGRHY